MMRIATLIAFILGIIQQDVLAEINKKNEFTIHGTITGLRNGSRIYLIQYSNRDTVYVGETDNGNFILRGKVSNGTEYYFVRLDSSISKVSSNEFLLINSSKLTLRGNIITWPKVDFYGSLPHEEFLQVKEIWDKEKKNPKERLNILKQFIYNHLHSLYIPDLIRRLPAEVLLTEKEQMYKALSDTSKESFFGTLLLDEIKLSHRRLKIKEGADIPDFSVLSLDDSVIAIKRIVQKSKYTLIDFWASWCGPCKDAIPEIKRVYNKFKNKGFNVVSIALNDKPEKWKKAIKDLDMVWENARDIFDTTYKLFNIRTIPAYLLVDSNGKMISYVCSRSLVPGFGPPITEDFLFKTIDSLLLPDKQGYNSTKEKIRPLIIGEKIDDLNLGEAYDFPGRSTLQLKELRGKLVILDFWSTSCAVCISLFPKMNDLQNKFGERIAIIPVGFDEKKQGSIKSFLESRKGTEGELKLPSVIQCLGDTLLMKLFPFWGLPHEVWISPEGELLAITDHRAVTEANIQSILNGNKLPFKEKKINKRMSSDQQTLFLKKNNFSGGIVSAFGPFIDSFYRSSTVKIVNNYRRGYWINFTVYDLYKYIYIDELPELANDFYDRRIVIENPLNRRPYLNWCHSDQMNNWEYDKFQTENLISYEFFSDTSISETHLKRKVQTDLDSFLQIKSSIELRDMNCLSITKRKRGLSVLRFEEKDKLTKDGGSFIEIPLGSFIHNLSVKLRNRDIILDETKSDPESMIVVPNKMGYTLDVVQKVLRKSGFDIKKNRKVVKILVLKM